MALRRADCARAERPLVSVHARQQRDRRRSSRSRKRADLVHAAGGLLHVDAVQAAGRIALRYRAPRRRPHDPVGPQDRRPAGRRRAGLGASATADRAADQRRRPGARLRGPEPRMSRRSPASARRRPWRPLGRPRRPHGGAARPPRGRPQAALPETRRSSATAPSGCPIRALFAVPGMKAETALIAFDLAGVAVSSGSACSSGKVGLERAGGHGRGTRLHAALRISLAGRPRRGRDLRRLMSQFACLDTSIRVRLNSRRVHVRKSTVSEAIMRKQWPHQGRSQALANRPYTDESNPRSLKPRAEGRMPAVQETVDQVRRSTSTSTSTASSPTSRSDKAPKGLNEDIVRFISAKKNEPEWMLEWRLEAYRRWLTMTRADLGARQLSDDRLPGRSTTTPRRSSRTRRSRSTRSIPRCSRPTRSSAFR